MDECKQKLLEKIVDKILPEKQKAINVDPTGLRPILADY